MTAHSGHRTIKSRIGNSKNANPVVIMRHVLNQPVNSIVGIAGFIILTSCFVGIEWAHIYKFPFTHPSAAYILQYDDVTFAHIISPVIIPESAKIVFTIGGTTI